jgi:hypothetical protein
MDISPRASFVDYLHGRPPQLCLRVLDRQEGGGHEMQTRFLRVLASGEVATSIGSGHSPISFEHELRASLIRPTPGPSCLLLVSAIFIRFGLTW